MNITELGFPGLTAPCQDSHRALWPGVAVPKYTRFKSSGKAVTVWAPTSVMVAGCLAFFRTTKRSMELRNKPFLMIRAMVEAACSSGMNLVASHVDLDGNETEHSFWIEGSPSVSAQHLWNTEFFETYVASEWAFEVNQQSVPWVSSPGEKPHLADWLAFVLDVPQTERIRSYQGRRAIIEAKKIYAGSALGILTQLAHQFNSTIRHCTEELGKTFMKDEKGAGCFF